MTLSYEMVEEFELNIFHQRKFDSEEASFIQMNVCKLINGIILWRMIQNCSYDEYLLNNQIFQIVRSSKFIY